MEEWDPRSPVIFARIGWMDKYEGPRPGDERPIGGGSWNDNHLGHEVSNFLDVEGRLYGYFEPGLKSGELSLKRVGQLSGSGFVDDVTVVFLAPRYGAGSLVVVGWYEHARLYSDTQEQPKPIPGIDGHSFICETSKANGHLLGVSDRAWPGVTGPGGFGQRNFCYALDEEGRPQFKDWMKNILAHISGRPAQATEGSTWSQHEVRAVVEAYFQMLSMEAAGRPFSKSRVRERLQRELPGRSGASIEYKFQNVSAILDEDHFPWVDGYKPARNYQRLLADEVRVFLSLAPSFDSPPPKTLEGQVPVPDPAIAVQPPPVSHKASTSTSKDSRLPRESIVNHARKEEENRELGLLGERFVLELERARLRAAGRPDLADKVEHSSVSRGDGLGYDLTSYTPDGKVVRVEVKTTRLGPEADFFMSSSELAFAEATDEDYRLARVYHWGKGAAARVFELNKNQVRQLQREPTHYRCWV